MRPFRYERARDAASAVATVAAEARAAYLAGGTNLVDHLKLGLVEPELLVDVSRSLDDTITDGPDGSLRIGAGVRNSDLAADRRLRTGWPVVSQALLAGASGQLRNLATTGGNLLQRTRCSYFQDVSTPCNKREPGSGCSALGGWTRYHAILGASEHCVAVHPSDLAVALAVTGATVRVTGTTGERTVQIGELHRLPGTEPDRDTVLGHGDLITGVDLPPLPAGARSAYHKVRDRASYAFALVSVAASLTTDGDTVRDVRIALGGVAHKPWRATRAEAALTGGPATASAFLAAAETELEAAEPLPDNGFKVPLARNAIAYVLGRLAGRSDGQHEGEATR